MRYGFWLPVFGGWLRNIDDEQMPAVRPTFHSPALLAKQAANIDRISNGRLTLNVVSSWWADEAKKYGIPFDEHDDRYARTSEWLDVLTSTWSHQHTTHQGRYYNVEDNLLSPKPHPTRTYSRAPQPSTRPTLYAGGESETAKNLIAAKCDAYLMHGDNPATIADKVADMKRRRAQHPHLPEMIFGVTGYCIVRDSEFEANREVDRITQAPDPTKSPAGFANFQQWITGSQLEKKISLRDYSVSNRGLQSGLIGTPETVAQRLADFEAAGCSLVLLQSSPQHTEMARFAAQVMHR
jgi:FMNH2-dependent dimethyl sulfone monooxygenase